MKDNRSLRSLELFATCPQSKDFEKEVYPSRVAEVARWSERYGYKGILVYTDNSIVDPWLVSTIILENTSHLCPLVAVQPAYMHPYAVAKMVASFGFLYSRRLYLNMVAGGFTNDLVSLDDTTPHDRRYDRIVEYTTIVKQLLVSAELVTFKGEFFTLDKLRMTPPLPAHLIPGIFLSGSSDAGLRAAKAIGATAVKYPKPASGYASLPTTEGCNSGIRIGVIARASTHDAWGIAEERFPEDHKGELTHKIAMKVSDSVWHKQLSELATEARAHSSVYWLRPFETYKTFCPYLVGDYDSVAAELAKYIQLGFRTFILDIPPIEEELHHTKLAFERAIERC